MENPTPEMLAKARKSIMIKGSRSVVFPVRLHFILEEVDRNGQADIVSWLPDGKAFAVHNRAEFCKQILVKYFNTNSFKSFQRNLHLYGFTTATKGYAKGVISHPQFVKGDPKKCSLLPRVLVKNKQKNLEQKDPNNLNNHQTMQEQNDRNDLNPATAAPPRPLDEPQARQPVVPVSEQPELPQAEPVPDSILSQAPGISPGANNLVDTPPRDRFRKDKAMASMSSNDLLRQELARRGTAVSPSCDSAETTANAVPAPTSEDDMLLEKSCTEAVLTLAQEHEKERLELQDQIAYLHMELQKQAARQAEQKHHLLESLTAQVGADMMDRVLENLLDNEDK